MSQESASYPPLDYVHIESWSRYLLGNVLTLMDASFADVQQRKAVKDLIKKQFRDNLTDIAQACSLNRTVNSDPLIK